MQTNMRETSLAAHRELEADGDLQKKEIAILRCFGPGTKLSRQQLVPITNIPINCITGRVRRLLDMKRLVEDGERIDPITRKRQALLRLPEGQMELFH